MKKSMKAALLSAFVFPGAGHFFLKKHITGTVLAVFIISLLVGIIDSYRVGRIQDKSGIPNS
jgi:hypothetical protein